MSAEGRPVASGGTALPNGRPVPHAAAGSGRRWRADGCVKKTALAKAASHQALAGERQRARAADARERLRDEVRHPVGPEIASRQVQESSRVRPVRGSRSPTRVSTCGAGATSARPTPVERGRSSDMLPRLNCPVIPRGFEFSATYDRCCRPAAGTAAANRSRRRCRGLAQAAERAWTAKLDRVRSGPATKSRAALDPTPGGGARGVIPSPASARGCAGRSATARRPLGFRTGAVRAAAARALHRKRSGWPIEWSL